MHICTKISDEDACDCDKIKRALLTRYNFTEDGYRKRFRDVKPDTEESPDQVVIHLKNYLAKWLDLSGSSSGDFDARNQKKIRAMVAKSDKDGEEAFTCLNVERPRSSGNSKKSISNGLTSNNEAIYSAAGHAQINDG